MLGWTHMISLQFHGNEGLSVFVNSHGIPGYSCNVRLVKVGRRVEHSACSGVDDYSTPPFFLRTVIITGTVMRARYLRAHA